MKIPQTPSSRAFGAGIKRVKERVKRMSCTYRKTAALIKLKNMSSSVESSASPEPVAAGRLAQQRTAPIA